jgi:subtilisin family serine protease
VLLFFALFLGLTAGPALAAPAPKTIPGEILIKFRPGTPAAEQARVHRDVGAQTLNRFGIIGVEHWKVSGVSAEAAIARLQRNPNVAYVEPNFVIELDVVPNDPRFPELYGMRNTGQSGGTAGADIKATLAWDQFTGDPNLKVGVIDTGVDYNHPDLAANIWTNPGEIPGNSIDDDNNGYVDDVHGYDFANSDGDPFDDNGHGSHCSGTIAGVGNNNTGVVGVCWQAKIVGIKFLSGGGSGSTAGAIAGVQYAITIGTKLTSNSWGGGGFSQALLDAINAAGAQGQLFIAAAGNSSANTDTSPHYPSAYNSPYIVSVAATDHNDNLASFSNYGATTVDLAAPGVAIVSTVPGNSYASFSGTSMATPHVSGAVALAMGRFPAVPNLQIKTLLLNAVDVKPSLDNRCLTEGRLNAFMTIAEPDDTPPGMIADLSASNPGSNTMTLAWTSTGDDGNTGRATSYEIRYATSPITEATFGSAALAPSPDPLTAGSPQTTDVSGLSFSTTYWFAIKAFDEFNNSGPISNLAMGTTLGAPDITASPASFSAELLTGAVETQTLTLRNDAAGTLDFTIPTPELQFSQPAPAPHAPLAKGEPDVESGPPVTDSKGGPDGFGYRWLDSDEPGGPVFAWADITGVGAPLALTGDDANAGPVPIGFDFPFYGGSFNSVRVCTNGWLSFTATTSEYDNAGLPSSGGPANLIAPFWDDMDFGTTPRVYTYNDGARFIVSWVGAPRYQTTGTPYTFQAILYPNGEVRYQYLTLGSVTNSATVGIQNATKTVGLTVAYNTSYLRDNLAVRIVPLQQWLSVTPTSGRILAGQSQDVQVRFNALGLVGGTFAGTVRVLSNDPDEATTDLPASLHVIGAPDLAVNPTALDYGTIFAGATVTRNVTVSNPGTDNLDVTSITSSDPTVTVSHSAFTLAPLSAQIVTATWHPTSPMTLAGSLTIASNDPDSPAAVVSLAGEAVPAPSFSVDPTSFDVSLLTNTSTTRTLRIDNSGGSNYVFTAETQVSGPTGSVVVGTDADNVFVDKDGVDVQSGPTPLRSGGPDVFGYTYQDSDEDGGPVFAWEDIRAVGTQIVMTGDDANTGPYPIGFDFPFYGQSFGTFRVCTNGWISFTSTRTTFSNTSLPNTGTTVPENMLAAFWDDLHFDTTRRAYYYYDGTKLVVQYQDVRRVGETASNPNTFQILLYPNGTIVYQYLSMTAVTKTSATIGIQNAARNDGLQVVFNAAYVKNNLAIRFRPPARFLTVSPNAGTVPPGGFMNLTVGFNAADLFGGDYDGIVRISGNDPVLPQRDLPAVLHVTGVPDIAASPSPVEFGNTYIGYPSLRQLSIQNEGTDALLVSNITTSQPALYGVDQSSFTVPPLGTASIFVSFSPAAVGPAPATLTIHSNDPDTPTYDVALNGAGLVAPDVATAPGSLASTLPIPNTETQTLTVQNLGGSDLTFVVGTSLTASAVPIYDELPLAKEETDPREGVLGSGGPDVFGYTWRDSDDPNGPVFDWVDITGIGTPIALTGDDSNTAGVPIGFDFPYYGNTFNTVNVCTNGWLSFTSTATALTNQALPNSGSSVPENLLAAFWDDLNPGATQRIYRYSDGTRFILSYVAVPRFSSGGPYTFQVILYPSGRIVYQYLDMQGTRLNEATIGIQNAAKNDGLTVVFNAPYVHNNMAIEFRTTPDWMTVSPTSGTIPAGGSAALQVTFDAAELFGGAYTGTLRLTSNDPDEGVLDVPATLTAIGTPDVAATPSSLDFGTIYVGQAAEQTVELANVGSDVLTISGLSIANPDFTIVSGPSLPLSLGRNGSVVLLVRFEPAGACYPPNPCMANLVVSSNDPGGDLMVALQGSALVPPEAEVDPTSLKAALATTLGPTAIAKTKPLTLRNTGGSDLNWSASALSQLPAALDFTPSGETGKDQAGEPGGAAALASGGPDAYGYRYADSDDPVQGTPFDWVDITAIGTPIPFTGDDQNQGPFPLTFPFPYYGNTFTTFRACTNGWVSFTATQTSFTNTTLPNAGSGTPPNLLAPFWEDLTFSATGDVYYWGDASRFVISYVNVPRLTSGGPYTFQIILYPSGTIDFQYLDMQGSRLNEATVGIQNAAKDIGLQVAYNQTYVKNNLRVRFSRQAGWLTVTPASGVLPAGEETTLQVGFDATGLAEGDYDGVVRIQSNDLTDPVIDVNANLHIGVIAASVDVDPNSLNRSSSGNWVAAMAEPEAGYPARSIDPATLRLERQVPVAPGAPISYDDKDGDGLEEGNYKFGRTALSALLPEGNSVPVEMIGEVADMSWFQGTDFIRVLRPRMLSTMGLEDWKADAPQPKVFTAGTRMSLAWDDPQGYPAQWYDLWFSADNGESWMPAATGLTTRSYEWFVYPVETEGALLELVAMDGLGAMGSWISEPFTTVIGSPTGIGDEDVALPNSFGMRLLGANPISGGNAALQLAVPTTAPVDVRIFDIRGGLVRQVVSRALAPGWHRVAWDGRGESGRPVGSGVYFARMTAAGKTFTARLAVVR